MVNNAGYATSAGIEDIPDAASSHCRLPCRSCGLGSTGTDVEVPVLLTADPVRGEHLVQDGDVISAQRH
ncbi:hypothetical protein [Actinacidiphila soli]|uniref:hypothetical protein n=1 Tax=Actinacidiphila soli TaxID=2487275 RepID=UPI0013E36361|nr:hypothetical protein [Actinacidiphila soli]